MKYFELNVLLLFRKNRKVIITLFKKQKNCKEGNIMRKERRKDKRNKGKVILNPFMFSLSFACSPHIMTNIFMWRLDESDMGTRDRVRRLSL